MTEDLAGWLLDRLAEDEAELKKQATNPHEGLSDDQLHDRRAHPAYEYATTEGRRKVWDHEDVPPWDHELGRPGDGWERNRTANNPEAWERFDLHEEAYWRRLRPEGLREWKPSADVVFRLADIDAKRRILSEHPAEQRYRHNGTITEMMELPKEERLLPIPGRFHCSRCGDADEGEEPWPCATVRLLALPYADRPGYRDTWRV